MYNVGAPFQLNFGDLMSPITPELLDGYRYASEQVDGRVDKVERNIPSQERGHRCRLPHAFQAGGRIPQ